MVMSEPEIIGTAEASSGASKALNACRISVMLGRRKCLTLKFIAVATPSARKYPPIRPMGIAKSKASAPNNRAS
jgi:hypothetical protein